MSKLYNYIKGNDILNIDEDNKIPIIEGILSKGDYVLFVAEEKVGKTVFSQQLCCSLSNGVDFLKTFPINKPCKVWYMFNEVKLWKIKERFRCMSNGIGINTDNITLIYFKFKFNTDTGKEQLKQIVQENRDNVPDVIILDALYKAVNGSLKDDNVINDFNNTFSWLADSLGGCARVAVHHLTKPGKDKNGKYYKRTDKDTFGSAYLLADIDHCFRLEKFGDDPDTKERILKCDTQRDGDIIESTRLLMIEPDPLYYEVVNLHTERIADIIKLFNQYKTLTVKELVKKGKISRSLLYALLKQLLDENIIFKYGSKTKYYSLIKYKNEL